MLLPVLSQAKTRAKIPVCQSNQRQQYVAAQSFAGDYDGMMPDNPNMIYRDEPGVIRASADPPPAGESHSSYKYHPVVKLQDYKGENAMTGPIANGMGILYVNRYIPDGRIYYCSDQTLFYRESSVRFYRVGWRADWSSFVNTASQVRLGVGGDVWSSVRCYYVRRTTARQPERFDAIANPERVPFLADMFSWDADCEHSAVMKFNHGNHGSTATYLSGETVFRSKPTGNGPNYTANFATWVVYNSVGGAWGVDKGYWDGDKFVDPQLAGTGGAGPDEYDPNFKTGLHRMTIYDWWIFNH
jgi:hypothetical protein